MKVQTLDESVVREIGHAFGYYDDGKEPGFVSAFSSRTRRRNRSAAMCA